MRSFFNVGWGSEESKRTQLKWQKEHFLFHLSHDDLLTIPPVLEKILVCDL
jgi:hypothetical protein